MQGKTCKSSLERRGGSRHLWAPPRGELRDVGLHVRQLGSGSPTLVLLHGLAGSNQYFGAAFDALSTRVRLVVPDLLGFGASPKPADSGYGLDAHAAAVSDVLDRLQVEPPIYVAGHSAGSVIALRLAQLRVDSIRGVVVISPVLYANEATARRHVGRIGIATRLFATDTWMAQLACRVMCRFPGVSQRAAVSLRPDLPERIARDGTHHTWRSYSGSLKGLVFASQPFDFTRVQDSVRLVAGDSDAVLDRAYLAELVAKHAHVSIHDVRGGGHDLPITHAASCIAAIDTLMTASR